MANDPLRVAIVGTSFRSFYMYGPIVQALPEEVQLAGVWGRSEGSARRLGEQLGVPWYTNLDALMREQAPQIGIVSVAYGANGQVGLQAVEAGLHVLVETPIAHRLDEADAILSAAQRKGLKVEVAEQFHRRPLEQIKLELIRRGLFGRVHTSMADFAGHGYHGVSVMRSYLGFDAVPQRVTGAVRPFALQPHGAQGVPDGKITEESQEHAIVQYADGRLGLFHWSNIAYHSPMRLWWRSGRFLAERGMAVTLGIGPDERVWLARIAAGGEGPLFMTLQRRYERVDGGALTEMVVHTGDPELPIVRWENPFRPKRFGGGPEWHDDEIAVASCLMSLVRAVREGTEPSYGGRQGRLDQEITLAYRLSSERGGAPVDLPLDPAEQPG